MNTFTRAALTVLVGLVIWFLPHTEAIKPEGWHLLAIFTATIVGFILRPWPTGIMALFGIVVAVATQFHHYGTGSRWLCRGECVAYRSGRILFTRYY